MATKQPTPIAAEKGRAAAALRRFWQAGKRSLRRCPPDKPRLGEKAAAIAKEAAEEGLPTDTMGKARRFAAQYDQRALDALCAKIERYDAPFGPTAAIRLLAVPPGDRKA